MLGIRQNHAFFTRTEPSPVGRENDEANPRATVLRFDRVYLMVVRVSRSWLAVSCARPE
jgi:hypothetical protein